MLETISTSEVEQYADFEQITEKLDEILSNIPIATEKDLAALYRAVFARFRIIRRKLPSIDNVGAIFQKSARQIHKFTLDCAKKDDGILQTLIVESLSVAFEMAESDWNNTEFTDVLKVLLFHSK